VKSGDLSAQWWTCARDDQTFDIRNLTSTGSLGDDSNFAIGKDCGAARTAVVGGSVIGTIDHSLSWADVKDDFDAAALRLEGTDWIASYGLSATNVEDGIRPRVLEDSTQNQSTHFLVTGAHMAWIRDDAIEDDELMSGTIENSLIDGTNRFLSARPTEGTNWENPNMVVTITNVLVHMKAMPNDRDTQDGVGFGGIFKWSEGAGRIVMSDSIVLLDEQPISDEPFPKGAYSNVTLVLGPNFNGSYPTELPTGVRVTRDMEVWRLARQSWLDQS
jgi:hypothetical protein